MTYDRKDWDRVKHLRDEQHPRALAQEAQQSLHRLHQAAVSAEKLMADQHWALFQQMLQAQVERVIASRTQLVARLMSDQCSSYEDMIRMKRLIAECEATIRALTAAIDLPKQIAASGKDAEQRLAEIGEKYESELKAGGAHG